MSYLAGVSLQQAVYQHLRADERLALLVGDAIFDAPPVQAPGGVYVTLGPETMREAGDTSGAGAWHDFVISVLAGGDESEGFAAVKTAAAAVCEALEPASLPLERGNLVGLWLRNAKARRAGNGSARRVDLSFRARIDLG